MWKFLFVVALSIVATQGSNERKAVTCEHKQLDIGCGREEVINVISAMYGRTDSQTCSDGRNHATTSCRAKHATEIVRGRCQGKNDCLVTASNSVFGDPCVGTFKYLTVTYMCQSSNERKAVTCEHKQLDIGCGREEVINVISAMYGRTDLQTCSDGRNHATTSCRAKNATEIVRGRCQGKNDCLVTASNSVFGDPCVGTFKYLTVTYKCQRTIEINTVTCEHQQLDITCGRYEVIHVISVTYGRTDHSTCSRGDTTTRCRAGRATEIVSARCQGKHTCQITASNSVFGDPCVGTFKYMIVEYKCQSYQSDGSS